MANIRHPDRGGPDLQMLALSYAIATKMYAPCCGKCRIATAHRRKKDFRFPFHPDLGPIFVHFSERSGPGLDWRPAAHATALKNPSRAPSSALQQAIEKSDALSSKSLLVTLHSRLDLGLYCTKFLCAFLSRDLVFCLAASASPKSRSSLPARGLSDRLNLYPILLVLLKSRPYPLHS